MIELNNVSISSDISVDFENFKEIVENKVGKLSPDDISKLKQMHEVMYINRMLANDLVYDSAAQVKSLYNLNQHLLIAGIVLMIMGDKYTPYFLMRGSLEAFIKCMLANKKQKTKNSFSNNLEFYTSEASRTIQELIKDRTNKSIVKKTFNKFTTYGRKTLYGDLSEKIHIVDDEPSTEVAYLSDFFSTHPLENEKMSQKYISVLEYESVLSILNISAVKKQIISTSKIDFFRSRCNNDKLKNLVNLIMKYI